MSAADSTLPTSADQGNPFAPAPPARFGWVDEWLTKVSEWLNPILVKETRQALKSRQFLVTFILLLICGWGWSLFYLAIQFANVGQGIFYAPQGAPMLTGYYWVLSFPLLVIVPFTAFRSLSGEREDGTFELVAITTLKPRQIVGGKLGSAVLQMLVYLSALTPGMAFTYMLRGVDIILILMTCFYLFVASVFLSVVGLVLATVTTSRHWQMVLGIIFILGLVILFFYSGILTTWGINSGVPPYDQIEFWAIQAFIVSLLACYTLLFYLSSMARVTFASDNRSTKMRMAMLVCNIVGIGWGMWLWLHVQQAEALYALISWAAIHWWFMGSMMVGEASELSPRVRRELPQTFLGRMCFTWFNPGPGTGFMFAITNMMVITAVVIAAWWFSLDKPYRVMPDQVQFACFMFCYVVLYVGLTRLAMLLVDRVISGGIFVSALLSMLFLLVGTCLPLGLHVLYTGYFGIPYGNYSLFALPSPFCIPWGLDSNGFQQIPIFGLSVLSVPLELMLLIAAALAMLGINMLLAAREVDRERTATPTRVLEDEAELHPQPEAKPVATSPWELAEEKT